VKPIRNGAGGCKTSLEAAPLRGGNRAMGNGGEVTRGMQQSHRPLAIKTNATLGFMKNGANKEFLRKVSEKGIKLGTHPVE